MTKCMTHQELVHERWTQQLILRVAEAVSTERRLISSDWPSDLLTCAA